MFNARSLSSSHLSCCSRWPCAEAQRQSRASVQAPANTPAPRASVHAGKPKGTPLPLQASNLDISRTDHCSP